MSELIHRPVLLDECIEALNIRPGGTYLDGTLGRAGHSREIARRLVFSNSRNLGARQWQADFWDAADQAKEAIGWKF